MVRKGFTSARWLALTGVAATAIVCPAYAQQVRHFDIPRQDLASALEVFGRQSDSEILFDRRQTQGKSSAAVNGNLEPQDALRNLLDGTGLPFRRVNAKTFLIEPVTAEGAQSEPGIATQDAGVIVAEVIVTAQKRSERAQDVPSSISVLGGQQLENLHATSLQDYAAYAPGFVVSSGGSPGQTQITLRGLNALSSTTMVATVLDDAPLGSSNGWARESGLSFDMMPDDVERVEILRGPQGTLYGANSMGGLLKYVTRSPDLDNFESRLGAETFVIEGAGDLGYGGRASVNVPIVAGKLALRASVYDQETPGYVDNPTRGTKDTNSLSQRGGRLALLWQATDDVWVKLQAINQRIASDDNSAVIRVLGGQTPDPQPPQVLDPALPPYYVGLGQRDGDLTHAHALSEPFEKEVNYFSGTVSWNLDWAEFTSATSFAHTTTEQIGDSTERFGQLFGGRSAFHLELDLKRYTQEFRLASATGLQLEWLVGAYYSYEDSQNFQLVSALDDSDAPIPGLDPLATDDIPTLYREVAGFANATYRFNDAFDLTAGARWAKNKQNFHEVTDGGPAQVIPSVTTDGHSAEDVVTWAISPRYHIDADTMLYVRVASGYRPGGPNSNLNVTSIPAQVNSDTIINYEAGVKSQFWDRRALVNLTVFKIDWKDIQLDTNVGGNSFGVNGGTASSQGIELATAYTPVRGVQLALNAAYTDATITEDVINANVRWLDGAQLPTAPRWSGSFTADYEFAVIGDWGGRVGGGYRYVGKQYTDVQTAQFASRLEGYSALDLNGGVSNDRWNLALYIKNVTDKRAYTNQGVATDLSGNTLHVLAGVLQPRTIGLSVQTTF